MAKKYLAAISGGPDSMALLHMFKDEIKAVCHVNYKTRGPSSDHDEKRVIDFCKKHNIKYHIAICDPLKFRIKNFQAWARKMRYEFFQKMYKLHDCKCLITGHHKDDFIETAHFQQHDRKSKRLKLGFEEYTTIFAMNVYRPLIKFWKYELENYCKSYKIEYGIDESNATNKYYRNKVRNLIFSEWSFNQKQAYFDEIVKHNKANEEIEKEVMLTYKKLVMTNYDISYFKTLNQKIQKLIIIRFLSINGYKISENKVNGILSFLNGDKLFKGFRIKDNTFLKVKNKAMYIDYE